MPVIQLPEVVGMVLCDRLEFNPAMGKVSLVGLFQAFYFDRFPSPPRDFTVYLALSGGVGEGALKLIVTRLETDAEVYYHEAWRAFPNDRLLVINVDIPVRRCVFEGAGRYALTLYFDNRYVAERSFPVYEQSRGIMSQPETESFVLPHPIPLEYIYGVYFGPEGGISDNGVRPNPHPRHSNNGVPPPLPEPTSNAPDLLDWLARTFDD